MPRPTRRDTFGLGLGGLSVSMLSAIDVCIDGYFFSIHVRGENARSGSFV